MISHETHQVPIAILADEADDAEGTQEASELGESAGKQMLDGGGQTAEAREEEVDDGELRGVWQNRRRGVASRHCNGVRFKFCKAGCGLFMEAAFGCRPRLDLTSHAVSAASQPGCLGSKRGGVWSSPELSCRHNLLGL